MTAGAGEADRGGRRRASRRASLSVALEDGGEEGVRANRRGRDCNPESMTLRLPYGTRARIEREARKLGVSTGRFAREALLRELSRREADRPPERPRGPGME